MYGWAPLSIMGEEINKLESSGNIPVSYTSIAQDAAELELPILRSTSSDSMGAPSIDATNTIPAKNEPSLATAGTYLGIYNIYATTAQFIATFISMIAFSILEPGKSPELSNGGGEEGGDVPAIPVSALSGTAVSLAIGALCSLVAAILTFRLMKT